jgi:integrase/recombinase XerD
MALPPERSRADAPIIAGLDGRPVTHRNLTRRGFEQARDAAGLDPTLTFHDLRHAAASRMIAAGKLETEVADLLGHDVAALRRVYAHVFDRRAADERMRATLDDSRSEDARRSRPAVLGGAGSGREGVGR